MMYTMTDLEYCVLNLIINGLPSIPLTKGIDGVFMVERSLFYMVAKIEHFSIF